MTRQVVFFCNGARFCILPFDLYIIPSLAIVGPAIASSLVSVAAPVRLVMFLVPAQTQAAGSMIYPQLVVMAFMALEALMAMSQRDGRRLLDLLARTQVLDAKAEVPS